VDGDTKKKRRRENGEGVNSRKVGGRSTNEIRQKEKGLLKVTAKKV